MSRILMAATIGIGILCSGAALAQTMTGPNGSSDNATNPTLQQKMNPATQPGMAGTTSGAGSTGTGASSAAIGTGGTEKGDFSPEAPAVGSSQGETGANPNNPGGVSNSQ